MTPEETQQYHEYLQNKTRAELESIASSMDRGQYPERYRLVSERLEIVRAQPTPASPFSGEAIVQSVTERDKKKFNPVYLLVFSAIAFFLAGGLESTFESVLLLGAVVLIHEFGHLMAMKVFRYQNTRIFFLPLIGGLAQGKPPAPNSLKEAIVALMGPVVGLTSAYIFLWASNMTWSATYLELARLSFIINIFNLVPLVPLDGGQILQGLFFNRAVVADIAFKALGLLGLLYLAYELNTHFFIFVAVIIAMQIRFTYNDMLVLDRLRVRGLTIGEQFNADTAQTIGDVLVEVENIAAKPNTKLAYVANRVEQIHHKAHKDAASWVSALLVFAVYAAAVTVGLLTFVEHFPLRKG
ncbi:MAG: site-2 protease family protein [Spirochaetota bacterium]